MGRRLVVCCLLLALLAGCSSPGTGPDDTTTTGGQVAISVSNEDRTTYLVRVAATEELDGVTVVYADGTTRRFDVRSTARVPPEALDDAADLELHGGPDAVTRSYSLPPGTGFGDTLLDVPRNASVFYVVTERGSAEDLRTQGSLRCGPDAGLSDLRIAILEGGNVDALTNCVD